MKIEKKYFVKYFEKMAIEQIAEDYTRKGYTVTKEEMLGEFRADLIAKKDGEQLLIEVKSGKMTQEKKERIAKINDYIQRLGGYKFILVVVTPPNEKNIEIDDIETLINNHLTDSVPPELDALSTHTSLDEVTDIDIDEIEICCKNIVVKGNGVLTVKLQFSSDGDLRRGNGSEGYDSIPFKFNLTLTYDSSDKLQIEDDANFDFDTSAYNDNE